MSAKDPVVFKLCSQKNNKNEVDKAKKKIAKKKKEIEKQKKKLETAV